MRPRFYVPDLDPLAATIHLPDDEAEHLARVLRLGAGAEVEIFDGRGGLWRAEVVQAGKRGVQVKAGERAAPALETRLPITLVSSVLKSDKMDDVVRDAVMLGVAAIQPVLSARSEIGLAALARGRRAERWRRIAVVSAKQCGRAVVPPVHDPMAFGEYLAGAGAGAGAGGGKPLGLPETPLRLLCVEPSALPGGVRSVHDVPSPSSAHVIVGPEGGWTPDEVASAVAAGVVPISLGGRTLRADAVPLVALTALLTTWSAL
ncbi:MAG: 16S rRNA (uracil(1498)-N(3))-methyltransferase [Vicinamibacterales bacterium]